MRNRLACIFAALAMAACGGDDDDTDGGDEPTEFDDQQIIVDFADQVVIPTYELLAERTTALDQAAAALAETPSEESLEAAKAAWVEMRVPWEQSEGFLFGPVVTQNWDPQMDSWPLNKDDLEAVLASGDEFTPTYIANLQETQKGFHTVEYILWGDVGTKTFDQLTPRELEYLLALTLELVTVTGNLETSWTEGVDGGAPYREVFTTAGEDGNSAYPSLTNAVQEIRDGMSGICDEVATGKIAGPWGTRDPNEVESQYSFNSLFDFQDNMRGVLNAYTGDFPAGGTEGRGLDEWVAERDAALDQRLRDEVDAAIEALGEIPAPFREAIQDPANDDVIEAAQQAIATVQDTVDGDLTELLGLE